MGDDNTDEARTTEGDEGGVDRTRGTDTDRGGESDGGQTDGAGATPAGEATTDLEEPDLQEYWARNVRLIAGLFVAWFAVSFLAAILLAVPLSDVPVGTLPMSFWFAQQGAIIAFVLIILVYVRRMNKLDREYGVED